LTGNENNILISTQLHEKTVCLTLLSLLQGFSYFFITKKVSKRKRKEEDKQQKTSKQGHISKQQKQL